MSIARGHFGVNESDFFQAMMGFLPAGTKRKPIIAIVGGGGKTSALFALAAGFADSGPADTAKRRVALTTTTHIFDPRTESGRRFDALILNEELARRSVGTPGAVMAERALDSRLAEAPQAGIAVIAAGPRDGGRLGGIDPAWTAFLRDRFDAVLVEADGSRGLPIKAPAAHEPVIPAEADLVLGLIGLDCLGRPMGGEVAHRPELLGPLVGCAADEPLGSAHLRALAEAPDGLFKGAPSGARRLIVLNKSDLIGEARLRDLIGAFTPRPTGCDGVLICSIQKRESPLIEVR